MRQPTDLEKLAQPIAGADGLEARSRFNRTMRSHRTREHERVLSNLGFGSDFTDYMAHATWTAEEGWHNKVVEPYGHSRLIPLAPSCTTPKRSRHEGLSA